eukprot:TRINITY_DN2024_c0_g1_i3.p1 TRINITY_DN2024_c0_g1~~TRINITY_DN2024_c0_g1_i3.p1  ORF type:complete len:216 (+),score=46.54 TRINITY_DN2024_c0_g1_i3:87-734(+)
MRVFPIHGLSYSLDSRFVAVICLQKFTTRHRIMHLCDTHYAGFATGMGTAPILGRIHCAVLRVGKEFFQCSFTVVDPQRANLASTSHIEGLAKGEKVNAMNSGPEFILGLDMLRRHQCVIDLKASTLKIGGEVIPFLAEKDIPHTERSSPSSPQVSADSSKQPQVQPQTQPQGPPADDERVLQLVALGASPEQAAALLAQCNGDLEHAANLLLQS